MKKFLALALVIVLALAMTACGGSGASADTPTDAANAFLKAVQEQDTDAMAKVYQGDPAEMDLIGDTEMDSEDIPAELSALLSEQMQQFEYEVSNEVVDEDTATVDVKITTVNIGKAFEDSINEFMEKAMAGEISSDTTEEELTKQLYAAFQEKLAAAEKDYEGTAVLNLTNVDGKWMVDQISQTDPLVNCLTGGLMDYSNSLTSGGDEAEEGAEEAAEGQ
ncbi:MAG: DUF4878 domain-containing protein [Firmicutes bacterium]|nr:DUF4878 domain-containing protein [Bacillota bacterium]